MKKNIFAEYPIVFFLAAFILGFLLNSMLRSEIPSPAYGGNFGSPMAAPQTGKYQIAGCGNNSAWVIDTESGDVFFIYNNGKWKEIGSITDETKRIKK